MKKSKMDKKGFRSLKAGNTAELYIYDDIGDSWMGGISAKDVKDELKRIGKVDAIEVYINSAGGSVFDGTAIHTQLERNTSKINVHIDGLAASIASLIAMAGDTVSMAQNAMLMVHDPWIVTGGTAKELREQADVMDKIKDNLVDTYAKKTGQDKELIDGMMAAETWIDAEEALDLGFIDTVDEPLRIAAHCDCSKFKNCPDHLKLSKFTLVKDAKPADDALKSRLAHALKTITKINQTG